MERTEAAVGLGWEDIKAQLPPDWEALATELGVIGPPRPYLGAKVTSIEPVLRLVLHHAGLEMSLRITTAAAAASGVITLSAVALHKWERKLAPYLSALLARMVESRSAFSADRWSGYEVVLADGTTATCPGSVGTDARVHYALRLADMALLHCRAEDEHGGETLRAFEAHPGQLWIADRCYSNPPGIAAIVAQGADVLVRLNRGALPLGNYRGQPFHVLSRVRRLRKPGAMREWVVRVHVLGSEPASIRGRLCAVRLPDDKAEEARQRLRKEYGKRVSAAALEAAAWFMVFTTVPKDRLSMQQVLELYRVRWQVELEIRRDKSIGGLSKLPNFRDDTIATWLYAKLILGQIARKMTTPAVAFPPCGLLAPVQQPLAAAGPPHATATHRGRGRRVVAHPKARRGDATSRPRPAAAP